MCIYVCVDETLSPDLWTLPQRAAGWLVCVKYPPNLSQSEQKSSPGNQLQIEYWGC